MVELKNSRGTVDAELPTCRSELTPSKLRLTVLAAVLLGTGQSAWAQTTPSAPQPFIEEQRQQERERALRAQQERSVDARLPSGGRTCRNPFAAIRNPLLHHPGHRAGW